MIKLRCGLILATALMSASGVGSAYACDPWEGCVSAFHGPSPIPTIPLINDFEFPPPMNFEMPLPYPRFEPPQPNFGDGGMSSPMNGYPGEDLPLPGEVRQPEVEIDPIRQIY